MPKNTHAVTHIARDRKSGQPHYFKVRIQVRALIHYLHAGKKFVDLFHTDYPTFTTVEENADRIARTLRRHFNATGKLLAPEHLRRI